MQYQCACTSSDSVTSEPKWVQFWNITGCKYWCRQKINTRMHNIHNFRITCIWLCSSSSSSSISLSGWGQKGSDENKVWSDAVFGKRPAEEDEDLWFGLVWFGVSSFDIQRLLERKELYSTHVRLQHLWYFNTVLPLEVLQNTAQRPLSGSQSRIEHMNKLFRLLIVLWFFIHRALVTGQNIIMSTQGGCLQ